MVQVSQSVPCLGFPMSVIFTDVEPEILAHEEASELQRYVVRENGAWQSYLRRVLPAIERGSANDMAQALRAAGTERSASIVHCETMRRRAITSGDVSRARFWDDVSDAIQRG